MINALSSSDTIDELKARAQALSPIIKKFRKQSNQQRDLAPEIVEAIKQAGLFRLYQPTQWGGLELDPRGFFEVQNILAESCASTAWVQGVLSVQSFVLALFSQQAQADVWQQDPDTLISSSFQPVGKVTEVDGGYRLSGHWTFSSGSSHAKWAIIGSLLHSKEAQQPPRMCMFLLPKKDYQLVDTWHTFGLRGTGSNDIIVEDIFVPSHRSFFPLPGIVPTSPQQTDLAPLYHLPWLYIFTSTVSNLSIGTTRAALNAFIETEKTRVAILSGKAAKEDPEVHRAIAQTSVEIANTQAMYQRHIGNMLELIQNNSEMPMNEGLLQRSELTSVMRKLTACVDNMQLLLGGRGIREDSPLTQIWLDMNAGRAHPGNDPRTIELVYGQKILQA